MTEHEICRSYREAKRKTQQIQIIAELNDTSNLEIIKILIRNGETLPDGVINGLYRKLDRLEEQIKEKEKDYREVVDVLTGGKR